MTEVDLEDLETNIRAAIATYEPRVTVSTLEFQRNDDDHLVSIILLASLNTSPNDAFTVEVNLATGRGSANV